MLVCRIGKDVTVIMSMTNMVQLTTATTYVKEIPVKCVVVLGHFQSTKHVRYEYLQIYHLSLRENPYDTVVEMCRQSV